MASKFNVDFLRRSDLLFELYARNYKSDEIVDTLRKKLRLMLAQEIPTDKKYISVEDIPEQVALCKQNLEFLKNDSDNLDESTTRVDASRHRDRLSCFLNRSNLLKEVCSDNNLEDYIHDLDTVLDVTKDLIIELNGKFPLNQSKSPVIRINCGANPNSDPSQNINQTSHNNFLSPSQMNNNPLEGNPSVQIMNLTDPNQISTANTNQNIVPNFPPSHVNPSCESFPENQISTPKYTSLYSKIQHPVIKSLSDLPCTDGLCTETLLRFFRIVLRILTAFPELKLQIFSLLVPYTRGPLLSCLLNNRERNDFDLFHYQAIKSFIPERQLVNIKQNLFWRKQADNERLADYIRDIKETALLLRLNLSEEQVVENILEGINYRIRACCTFNARPRNFVDLDKLCIEVMNIQFIHKDSHYSQRTFPPANLMRPSIGPSVNRQPTCFYCKRPGHVRQNCPVLLRNNQKNL